MRIHVDYSRCVWVDAALLCSTREYEVVFQRKENSLSSVSSPHLILSVSLPVFSSPHTSRSSKCGWWGLVEWSGEWEWRKASEMLLALLSVCLIRHSSLLAVAWVHNGGLQHFKTCLRIYISLRLRNSCVSGFHHCLCGRSLTQNFSCCYISVLFFCLLCSLLSLSPLFFHSFIFSVFF